VPQSGPQGQPAAASGNPTKTAVAVATDADPESALAGLLLGDLQGGDPDPAPGGDADAADPNVLSQDEGLEGGSPQAAEAGEESETDGDEPAAETPETPAEGDEPKEGEGEGAGQTVPVKRLSKEVAKRKAAEARAQAAEAEVEKLRGGEGGAAPAAGLEPWSPLARDKEYLEARSQQQQAAAELQAANGLLAMLDERPEQVAKYLRNAGYRVTEETDDRTMARILNQVIAKSTQEGAEAKAEVRNRERQAQSAAAELGQKWEGVAAQRFPWLEDDEDPRSIIAQKLQETNPWLGKLPVGRFAVGVIARELHAMELERARSAAAAKAGVQAPAANARGGSSGAVPKIRPGAARGSGGRPLPVDAKGHAQKQFEENPSEQSLARAILAELG